MRPMISIALSTYNGSRYLAEQLESIADQRRLPDELVVADDASTDGTLGIVTDFVHRAPFPVRLFRSPANQGLLKTFERAISECRGEVILLSDQDDVWLPEKVERFEEVFTKRPEVLACFSDARMVDGALRPLGMTVWEKERFLAGERLMASAGKFELVLLRHNVVQGASLGFRRELIETILPIPASLDSRVWLHDGWIAICVAVLGRVKLIDEPLISYRIHGANAVGNAVRPEVVPKSLGWMLTKLADVTLRRKRPLARLRETEDLINHVDRHWLGVMQALDERIPPSARKDRLNRLLRDRMAHASNRISLAKSQDGRVVRIAGDLLKGRYHRWSEGFIGAVRDLLQE
jgi:glycosyltransferase involved in cell wall biosynthesis